MLLTETRAPGGRQGEPAGLSLTERPHLPTELQGHGYRRNGYRYARRDLHERATDRFSGHRRSGLGPAAFPTMALCA
jgi:hypothetical protein